MSPDFKPSHVCVYLDPEIDHSDLVSQRKVTNRTRDHIVPREAIKYYRRVFRGLVQQRENIFLVCEFHHDLIDVSKLSAFHTRGLEGLTDFIVQYPRVNNEQELRLQYRRWINLVSILRRSFTEFEHNGRGDTMQLRSAANIAKEAVTRWKDGGIDAFIATGVNCLTDKQGRNVPFNLISPSRSSVAFSSDSC